MMIDPLSRLADLNATLTEFNSSSPWSDVKYRPKPSKIMLPAPRLSGQAADLLAKRLKARSPTNFSAMPKLATQATKSAPVGRQISYRTHMMMAAQRAQREGTPHFAKAILDLLKKSNPHD